jgi:hypothetical protein
VSEKVPKNQTARGAAAAGEVRASPLTRGGILSVDIMFATSIQTGARHDAQAISPAMPVHDRSASGDVLVTHGPNRTSCLPPIVTRRACQCATPALVPQILGSPGRRDARSGFQRQEPKLRLPGDDYLPRASVLNRAWTLTAGSFNRLDKGALRVSSTILFQ